MSGDGKRVELIDENGGGSTVTSYIGLGLIGSLIIGYSPLLDAIQGNGSFENAMLRFLACVAVSVGASTVIGRMLNVPPGQRRSVEAGQSDDYPDGSEETSDLNPPALDG